MPTRTHDANPRNAPSDASHSAPKPQIDGFKFIQSWRDAAPRSHASIFTAALATFTSTAVVSASAIAYTRSRTKAERDLPPGTHWRAAILGSKALGASTAACVVGVASVVGIFHLVGVRTIDDIRRVLRAGTQSALDATPGGLSLRESDGRRRSR
jgi:hypothetical protein